MNAAGAIVAAFIAALLGQAGPPDVREEVAVARENARANPQDVGARLRLGNLLVELGDPAGGDELEAALRLGISGDAEFQARGFMGFARQEAGRDREALEAFRQVAARAPAGSVPRVWAEKSARSIAESHGRIAEIGASERRSVILLGVLAALAAAGFAVGAFRARRGGAR